MFTIWTDLKDIRLSEISSTQKDKYCVISLIQNVYNKFIGTESRLKN